MNSFKVLKMDNKGFEDVFLVQRTQFLIFLIF